MKIASQIIQLSERDKPKDVITLLALEFNQILGVLQNYPKAVKAVEMNKLRDGLITLCKKMQADDVEVKVDTKGRDYERPIEEAIKQVTDLDIFKVKYLKWSLNLVKKLNGLKRVNKWHWLDVAKVAKELSALKVK